MFPHETDSVRQVFLIKPLRVIHQIPYRGRARVGLFFTLLIDQGGNTSGGNHVLPPADTLFKIFRENQIDKLFRRPEHHIADEMPGKIRVFRIPESGKRARLLRESLPVIHDLTVHLRKRGIRRNASPDA